MSFENDQVIRRELASGERLLWSSAPLRGIRLRASDTFMIPFSLMWGGFAIFWEFSVTNTKAPVFMDIWGIPFVLIGLYMIFGRFFLDSYLRGRTLYAVTDQRVLIIGGGFSHEVRSLPLRNLTEMNLQERRNGNGSIVFGSGFPGSAMFAGTPWPGAGKKLAPAFDLIADVRKVYGVLQEAQKRFTST